MKKKRETFSMRKTETMLRSGWTSFLCTKRCKIAVCSSSINNRRWVLTSPQGCLWILKCDLKKIEDWWYQKPEMLKQTTTCKQWKTKSQKMGAYKSIAFGSSSVFICNNNSLQDLSKLLKVPPHSLPLSLPSQTPNKDFGESCVIVLAWNIVTTHHLKLPWLRHQHKHKVCQQRKARKEEDPK